MPFKSNRFWQARNLADVGECASGSFGETNNVLRTAANLLQITLEMLVTVRNRLSRDNSESYSEVSNSYLNNIAMRHRL